MIDSTKLDQVLSLSQTEREREDVWFVLLDVPNRESLFVPPGMALLVITGVFFFIMFVVSVLVVIDCCV